MSDPSSTPSGRVDGIDRTLLRILAEDGRIGVAELARRANISRASAYARLDRLTTAGVVRGYRALIDHRAVGLRVAALIQLVAEQGRWRELRQAIEAVAEVEWLGLVAGDFDFMILVRARSTGARSSA